MVQKRRKVSAPGQKVILQVKQAVKRKFKRAEEMVSNKGFTDGKVNMVTLAKGKSHWKTRIDPDWRAGPNEKVATAEIASDGGSFLFSEVAGTLVGTECRGRSASVCAIVVIILLMRHAGCSLQGCIHGRRCKLDTLG